MEQIDSKKDNKKDNGDEQFMDIIDGDAGKLNNPQSYLINQNIGEIDLFDEDEFEIKASGEDAGDDKFDMYVGVLQEVLLEPQFEKMTKSFSNKNCMEFEATEENKLCYMSIFKEYQNTIEGYLMERLQNDIPDFSMDYFSNELKDRKDEIDE